MNRRIGDVIRRFVTSSVVTMVKLSSRRLYLNTLLHPICKSEHRTIMTSPYLTHSSNTYLQDLSSP